MKSNYVLVDYENIQPETAAALVPAYFKVLVFVGANQPRVNVAVASELQQKGADAQYIRIVGNGRNALDFHITYYLGRLAAAEPDAYFHVITADKGMDPLMLHMQAAGVHVWRHDDIHGIPLVKLPHSTTEDQKLETILAYLVARGRQRPASTKTLSGSTSALFQPRLAEGPTEALLGKLEAQGIFRRDGTRVIYSLPT